MADAAVSTPVPVSSSKGLNIALWIVQVLIGLAFIGAGLTKSFSPIAELGTKMLWVTRVSPEMVRFIGISELLGGLGLILPSVTRIKPILTPIAAAALTLVMILAVGHHVQYNEAAMSAPSIVLGALAAFVAWGRYKKAPITPRA